MKYALLTLSLISLLTLCALGFSWLYFTFPGHFEFCDAGQELIFYQAVLTFVAILGVIINSIIFYKKKYWKSYRVFTITLNITMILCVLFSRTASINFLFGKEIATIENHSDEVPLVTLHLYANHRFISTTYDASCTIENIGTYQLTETSLNLYFEDTPSEYLGALYEIIDDTLFCVESNSAPSLRIVQNDNSLRPSSSSKIEEHKLEEPSAIKHYSTQASYSLNDLTVQLTQTKNNNDLSCQAKIVVSRGTEVLDSLLFTAEPVGGPYGISQGVELENHLIFTKHGDYDGRTIIISPNGHLQNTIGGINYYDSSNHLLFCNYASDLGGFAVYDLLKESILFSMIDHNHEFISFHREYGDRFFATAIHSDSDTTWWEIEPNNNRMYEVELSNNEINSSNALTRIPLKDVNCECVE